MPSDSMRSRLLALCPQSRLTPISAEAASHLRSTYPGIPEDYLRFLIEVGYGTMGGSRFAVYSAPFTPADIYDIQTASALDGILLVGDDFSGYCIGYDTRSGWCFGGVNGCGEFSPEPRVATFTQFIEDWFFG